MAKELMGQMGKPGGVSDTGPAKSDVAKIKEGIGRGPGMGVGGEVDPTSQSPKKVRDLMDFMSDAELKPNLPSPFPKGGTRSA